jgi:GT2 family glycosyltransferase
MLGRASIDSTPTDRSAVVHIISAFLILAAASAVFATLVFVMLRSPLATAALVLVVFVITEGIRDAYEPIVTIRSISIHGRDVLVVALICVAAFRAISSRTWNGPRVLALALLPLLALHTLRGVLEFGLQTAVNDSRLPLYFIAGLAYASTVPGGWDARVWRLFPSTGLVLIGIACGYYATEGYHSAGEFITRNGTLTDMRPIVAAGALVVLESLVLLSMLRWPSRRVTLSLALVTAVGLLALQERTVWIAGIVAGLTGVGIWAARWVWHPRQILIGAATAVSVLLAMSITALSSHALTSDIREPFASSSTFAWRIKGWRALIAQHHSLSDSLIGLPAGTSFRRIIDTSVVTVSSHSLYVEQYLRFGIPGVILIVALGFFLWKRRREIASRVGLTSTCVTLLLLVVFTFGLTYYLDLIQGLVLGIFVASMSTGDDLSPAPIEDERPAEPGTTSADASTRVTAILASHNRREQTVACLRSYFGQIVGASVTLEAVLVDAGSNDGTATAAEARFAGVRVIRADASLYWAASMARAESEALALDPDVLLWLNDDVVLEPDTVTRLLRIAGDPRVTARIAVGRVYDPVTDEPSYGGVRRVDWHPLRFALVPPAEEPVEADTFNGNVVLVTRAAAEAIGAIDGGFAHATADFDYGLRAHRLGIPILVGPGHAGVCRPNSDAGIWRDPTIGARARLRSLLGPKGLPPRSLARYLRRHGGRAWPFFWIVLYLKFALSLARRSLRFRR